MANLAAQKTRTVLTTLGVVFGVGSVIGMLAIGAGAREESLRFIEQLGVRNVLIDSRPATSSEELQQRRKSSMGLSERDLRIIEANIEDWRCSSAPDAASFAGSAKALAGCSGALRRAAGLRRDSQSAHRRGKVLRRTSEDAASAAVCVLGESAKVNLLGYGPGGPGQFIKVNDTWLGVVGMLGCHGERRR